MVEVAHEFEVVGCWLVAYVRMVKTASGATAVQIVYSSRRGSRQIEHLVNQPTSAALPSSPCLASVLFNLPG